MRPFTSLFLGTAYSGFTLIGWFTFNDHVILYSLLNSKKPWSFTAAIQLMGTNIWPDSEEEPETDEEQ